MSKSVAASVSVAGLPESLTQDEQTFREFVRACIKTAFELRLEPDLSAAGAKERRSVMTHLTGAEAAFMEGLMRKQGVTLPRGLAAGRLAEAGMPMTARPVADDGGDSSLAKVIALTKPGEQVRPEQQTLYCDIAKALGKQALQGAVVAAQASTGVGKTAVAQAVVLDEVSRRPDGICVVAFPSLALVKQFAISWFTMANRDTSGSVPRLSLLFGRAEYVSEEALKQLADELEAEGAKERANVLRTWGAAQAEITDDQLVPPWMMDSLLREDEQLDRETLAINASSDAEDGGVIAYRRQFEKSESASVIACSHAMLAIDILLRWRSLGRDDNFRATRKALSESFFSEAGKSGRAQSRERGERSKSFEEIIADCCLEHEQAQSDWSLSTRRLPPYDFLVVDEAHLLEQAFSNVFSRSVSLRVTQRNLYRLREVAWRGAKGKLGEACDAISTAVSQLSQIGKDGEEVRIAPIEGKSRDVEGHLVDCYAALKDIPPPPETASALAWSLWEAVRRDTETLRQAVNANVGGQKWVSFTPVRKYPHLVIGSGNVRQPLNILWAGVREALLLSATLYLKKEAEWSARYCCTTLLAVPPTRQVEIPVVEAPWLFKPVTGLFMPERVERSGGPKADHWLCPPSRGLGLTQVQAEKRKTLWLDEVAEACEWVHRTAAGGSLLLCTSIEAVNELAERLQVALGEEFDVVASTKVRSLLRLRESALECAQQGRRPVLIGTGGTWTGFNVSGDEHFPPGKDNVITDLVITRVPFGMNRSLTHRARLEESVNNSMMHEANAVAMMGKQGIGRLVRRDGLPRNRRIFVLDGRLKDSGSIGGSLALFKNLLRQYPEVTLRREVVQSGKPIGA